MVQIWLISDTHFAHENMYAFRDAAGERVRREFLTATEADEAMIERWNAVVKPQHHVYHLGDVTMLRGQDQHTARAAAILSRLNGHLRLILGNHDHNHVDWYSRWFEKIKGQNMLDGYLMTHYPVHPDSLGKAKANVHGHIHRTHVMMGNYPPRRDTRYINVSVEVINYTPVALEDLATLHQGRA